MWWQPIDLRDDFRAPDAHKSGGFALSDPVVIQKYRAAMHDLLYQVGKQLLTGKMQLYKVSFPIKAMSPVSILEVVAQGCVHAPLFLGAAV